MDFRELAQRYRGDRATEYDNERTASLSWRREHVGVESFLREIPGGSTVLDVPIGTGRFLELYTQRSFTVTGIDISPDMLAQSAAKAQALGLAVELRQGDIRAIDAADDTFDAAVCIRFLNWVDFDGLHAALCELSRVATNLILGINCYDPAFAKHVGLWQRLRGTKRRLKRRIRGSALHIHDRAKVEALFAQLGLQIAGSTGTNPRPEGSDYLIYFLRHGPTA